MKLSYDELLKYMQDYFRDFEAYGQNPETIHKMDDYFSPDFEFRPYIADVPPAKGRDEWYKVLVSHPSGFEKLTPEDLIIDERRQVVAARIKAEITDSTTKKVLLTKRYFASYPLEEEKDGKVRIKRLEFFWELLPKGALEINDIFERDWKKQ